MTCCYEINDIILCFVNVVATQPFLISEELGYHTQGETVNNKRVSLKDTFFLYWHMKHSVAGMYSYCCILDHWYVLLSAIPVQCLALCQ
jgi:hypothetical protein